MIRNKNVANASWIISCKIIQSVLGVVISMLTARYLGPSQFGVINYAAAIVNFFVPIAQLGLTHVIVQEIVNCPESEGKILGTSIGMGLFSSVFCILGVVSFSAVANPGDSETIIVCALYSILLISRTFELIQYWFQAKLMSKYPSVVAVIVFLIISLYKAVILLTKQGIYWFAVSNAIDHLIIGIVLLCIYNSKSNHKLAFSFEWIKRLWGKSKYFIVSGMMVTIFAQTDKIMLKLMIDDAATGIYSAASACAGMSSFVFAAIIDSMRPTIVGNKNKDCKTYENSVCNLYSIIFWLALIQNVAMTLLAQPIVWVLYGKEFFASVPVLMVVVWHTTFSYIGSVRNVWILAEEKQRYLWIINLSGAIINVVLNLVLIPIMGALGAAIASVVTQFFTNFIIGFIIKPISPNNLLMIRGINPRLVISMISQALRK